MDLVNSLYLMIITNNNFKLQQNEQLLNPYLPQL